MTSRSAWLEETMGDLPCRVLLPARYEPQVRRYPLVVSLHGSGERGTDNRAQLKNGLALFEAHEHPCIVVAPQLPRGQTWGGSWYGGDTPGQRSLVGIVRELRSRSSVDTQRVYGVGYSMGAIGLWDILVREPGLFTAAVLVAGDLDMGSASSLTSFPLWSVVGARDDVVSPDNTRAFARLVAERGGTAKVTEIAGAGHDVWKAAFTRGPLWDWLFAQGERGAAPNAP
jgi:predicted peptidase